RLGRGGRVMMRRSAAVIVCVTASVASADDTQVRGQLVDEYDAPIAGATILRGDATAISDANGNFTIGGTGQLTIIAEGFASKNVPPRRDVVIKLARATGEVIEITGRAPEEAKPLEYTMSAADIS